MQRLPAFARGEPPAPNERTRKQLTSQRHPDQRHPERDVNESLIFEEKGPRGIRRAPFRRSRSCPGSRDFRDHGGNRGRLQRGTGGFIEICKTFTAPPAADASVNTAAPFTFTVTKVDDGSAKRSRSTEVHAPAPSACRTGTTQSPRPLLPWYAVTSIVETLGHGLTATDLTTGVADFTISDGLTETLTYTNHLVTGYLKICKDAASSNLTGSFSFAVSGRGRLRQHDIRTGRRVQRPDAGAGWLGNGCRGGYQPQRHRHRRADQRRRHGALLTSSLSPPNLVTGTASVAIDASPDTSTETVMTYTNDVVGLKVCKVWSGDASSSRVGDGRVPVHGHPGDGFGSRPRAGAVLVQSASRNGQGSVLLDPGRLPARHDGHDLGGHRSRLEGEEHRHGWQR